MKFFSLLSLLVFFLVCTELIQQTTSANILRRTRCSAGAAQGWSIDRVAKVTGFEISLTIFPNASSVSFTMSSSAGNHKTFFLGYKASCPVSGEYLARSLTCNERANNGTYDLVYYLTSQDIDAGLTSITTSWYVVMTNDEGSCPRYFNTTARVRDTITLEVSAYSEQDPICSFSSVTSFAADCASLEYWPRTTSSAISSNTLNLGLFVACWVVISIFFNIFQ